MSKILEHSIKYNVFVLRWSLGVKRFLYWERKVIKHKIVEGPSNSLRSTYHLSAKILWLLRWSSLQMIARWSIWWYDWTAIYQDRLSKSWSTTLESCMDCCNRSIHAITVTCFVNDATFPHQFIHLSSPVKQTLQSYWYLKFSELIRS